MWAIGYHGTSVASAERILAEGFRISRNDYDWLGDGAYFFQDAPARAADWARKRFGAEAAVIGAEIDLDDCLDLLDITWERLLVDAHQEYSHRLERAGIPLPRQSRGAHRLDRHVINYVAETTVSAGTGIRSVRAVFAEGTPIYPGSALLNRAHVQVAVRDPVAISRVWLER